MTAHLPADLLILGFAALLAAGVLSAGFADRLRVPGLLLFLGIGMVIGDDGLNLLSLSDPRVAQVGGSIALALILYQGGLTTRPGDLRSAAAPAALLATVGVAGTAAVVGFGTALLLPVDITTALMIGAVVASTDAAAVFAVLRRTPLPRRITALLEVESGFNDPMAIMLTIGLLASTQDPPGALEWLRFGAVQLVGGAALGLAVGYLGSVLLRRATLGPAGLYPVLALAICGLAYGSAAQLGASGFLAVYLSGLVVGARVPRHRRDIRTFHDGLANTAEIGLFLMLGVLVFPSQLPRVALPALAVAGVLIFVARPLVVFVCLAAFRFSARELVLLSWAGLRGAVPIVLAAFPFTAGHPDGETIFDVVFFVVLLSAALQGVTVPALSRRLGLEAGSEVWRPVAEALPLDGVDAELIEVMLDDTLHVTGKRVRDVPLPDGALLTTVVRDGRVIVPRGHTYLRSGDVLFIAVESRRRLSPTAWAVAWARGETAAAEPY